jgi:hypothetical protein
LIQFLTGFINYQIKVLKVRFSYTVGDISLANLNKTCFHQVSRTMEHASEKETLLYSIDLTWAFSNWPLNPLKNPLVT